VALRPRLSPGVLFRGGFLTAITVRTRSDGVNTCNGLNYPWPPRRRRLLGRPALCDRPVVAHGRGCGRDAGRDLRRDAPDATHGMRRTHMREVLFLYEAWAPIPALGPAIGDRLAITADGCLHITRALPPMDDVIRREIVLLDSKDSTRPAGRRLELEPALRVSRGTRHALEGARELVGLLSLHQGQGIVSGEPDARGRAAQAAEAAHHVL
jgi:hypothetical protein